MKARADLSIKLVAAETVFPGERYTSAELSAILVPQLERIAAHLEPHGLRGFADMFDGGFFERLGVESRNLVVDPCHPERWWQRERGRDPLARVGASAYARLMKRHRPLGPEDKLIVMSNVFDTTVPNLATYVISMLQHRDPDMVAPQWLSLLGEGCSGFISGLREAHTHILAHPGARVVLVAAEVSSPFFHGPELLEHILAILAETRSPETRQHYYRVLKGLMIQRRLFGDAAVAMLCTDSASDTPGIELNSFQRWTNLDPHDIDIFGVRGIGTKGKAAPPCGYFFQQPDRIFARLREAYAPAMRGALDSLASFPDAFAVHMGSGPIFDIVRRRLEIPDDLALPSLETLRDHGNMNTASGAAVVARLMARPTVPANAFLAFFGVGFTAQVAYLRHVP